MAKFFVRLLVIIILVALVVTFFAAVVELEEPVRLSCAWLVGVVRFILRLFDWPSPFSGAQALSGILILLPFLCLLSFRWFIGHSIVRGVVGLVELDILHKGIMHVFRSVGGVVAVAQMIRADDRKSESRHHDFMFADDDYQDLVKLFLMRIKKLQRAGSLVDHPEEENLRYTWLALLRRNRLENEKDEIGEYRELLKEDAGTCPVVLHVLLPYRYYGNHTLAEALPMYWDAVAEDFSVERIRDALASADNNTMKETAGRALKNLDWCIREHHERGAWPHPDKQKESCR